MTIHLLVKLVIQLSSCIMVMLSSADFFQKFFFQKKLSGLSAVCD